MYELKYQSDLSKLSTDEVEAIKTFVFDNATKTYVTIQLQDVVTFDYPHTELYGMYDMDSEELYNYNCSGGLWLYNHKKDIQELFK